MRFATITKRYTFEAAHHLPFHDGKCRQPHGHSYALEVSVRGPVRPVHPDDPESGMVLDFTRLTRLVHERVIRVLDHRDLNREVGGYTTAEHLAHWIWDQLAPAIPRPAELVRVAVWETAAGRAEITQEDRR